MTEPMRVYIAGQARDPDRARWAFDSLLDIQDTELAHDWLRDLEDAERADDQLFNDERARYALIDLEAVQRSDVLWLLATVEMIGRGAWIELGFAYGLAAAGARAPLVVVSGGDRRCIFTAPQPGLAAVELAHDLDALDFLKSYAPMRAAHRRDTQCENTSDNDEPTVPELPHSKSDPSISSSD